MGLSNESDTSEIPSASSSKDDEQIDYDTETAKGGSDDGDDHDDDDDANDENIVETAEIAATHTDQVVICDDDEPNDEFAPFYGTYAMEVDEQHVDSVFTAVVGDIRRNEGDLLSLVPYSLPTVIPRIHFETATIGRLSDPIGTSVVDPQSGLQGSDGCPVIDTSMPMMKTCHEIDSSVVMKTVNLSDTGVTHRDFVSKELFDGALKAVESRILEKVEEEVGGIKLLLKGKGPVIQPEPVQHSQKTPNTQPADLSIDELKSLLLAKLLSQAPDSQHDADLLTLLQSHQQNKPPQTVQPADVVCVSEFNSFKTDIMFALSKIKQVFQTSCKAQVAVSTRIHDHDPDNDHEGEKREKQAAATGSGVSVMVEERTENVQGVGSRVEKPKIATRQEILEITGLPNPDVIDLEDDTLVEVHAKYVLYWKMKEEGQKDVFVELDSDDEVVDVTEFVKRAQEIPEHEASVLDDLFEDRDTDALNDIEFGSHPNVVQSDVAEQNVNLIVETTVNPISNVHMVDVHVSDTQMEKELPCQKKPGSPEIQKKFVKEPPLVPKFPKTEAGPSDKPTVDSTPFTGYDDFGLSMQEIKRIRRMLRIPYLEEGVKIFVSYIRQLDQAQLLGIENKSPEYQKDYIKMLEVRSKTQKEVRIRHEIVQVYFVTMKQYRSIWFPQFEVQRKNLSTYTLNTPLYTVLREPELGVVYENETKKEKKFMREVEMANYFDGTLKEVVMKLEDKYKESEKQRLAENYHMPRMERICTENVIDAIKDIIRFRKAIRRFEGYLGLRKSSTKRWTN
ncbi:hypothetical protein L6452_36092 [Arctium lappa]|uniref:Uncharacterized protein n=1 Tax=Arctium lappa TaxID=4217 RepID=A0ACB8Y8R7_ARCLA|nr:hypothetical protein L6452_36092 [Arctium lappa]